MLFKAKKGLNGKINVEFTEVLGLSVYVFQMPNDFSSEYGNHGLLENNQFFK